MLKRNITRNLIILLIVTIHVSPAFFLISFKHFIWPMSLIFLGTAFISFHDHNFYFGEFKELANNVDAMETYRNPNLDWLNDYIRKVSDDLNISPPELWVAKDIDTCIIHGNHRKSKMIFPSSIIAYESKDVIKACVCHEIGHIVNYDSTKTNTINTIQLGLLGIPILIVNILELLARIPLVGLIAVPLVFALVLVNIFYCLLITFVYKSIRIPLTRYNEYSADKFAVNYLKNGEHLARILEKYLDYDPKGWRRWINLSTQPTIKKRILQINKMSLDFES